MIPYLNQNQREQIVVLALTEFTLDEMVKDKHFGSIASKDIKSARSFSKRAYSAIEDYLDEKERQRIGKFAKQSKIVIVPREKPMFDETIVRVADLQNLASFAIGNHCVGCERKDWRVCQLREVLENTGTPPANDDSRRGCRFNQ